MRKHLWAIFFWLGSVTYPAFATASQIQLQTTLSKSVILIGEQAPLQLVLIVPNPHVIQWPPDSLFLQKLELVNRKLNQITSTNKSTTWQLVYTFTGFDAGIYKIDSLPVLINVSGKTDTIWSKPIFVEVRTITRFTNPPHDIYGNERMPSIWVGWKNRLLNLFVVLLVAALIGFVSFKFRGIFWKKKDASRIYTLVIKRLRTLEKKSASNQVSHAEILQQVLMLLDSYFMHIGGSSLLRTNKNEWTTSLQKVSIDEKIIADAMGMLQKIECIQYGNSQADKGVISNIIGQAMRLITDTKNALVANDKL